MVNSIKKGQAFERFVARKLSYSIFPYLDKTLDNSKLPFLRVPLSGGWIQSMKGDIILIQDHPLLDEKDKKFIWPYTVECKWYKDFNLESLITSPEKSIIIKWWNQAVEEAKIEKKEPLLIFKKDNYEPFYMIYTDKHMIEPGFKIVINHKEVWVGLFDELQMYWEAMRIKGYIF